MSPSIWFWVIFVLWALFSAYLGYQDRANRTVHGASLVLLILLALLGWQVFGSPVKG
jgi:hypothetical protein